MSPTTVPDLSSPEVDERVADTIEGLATEPVTLPDDRQRRRLREILDPQANGDQDTW